MLQLAREIAMGLHDVQDVLNHYEVLPDQWEDMQNNAYFRTVLKEAVAEWQSALNTEQRIKVKAAALFEEWLAEANKLAHDPQQALNHKVELMKLLRAAGGMGTSNAAEGGAGDRLSVTINLGNDQKVKIEKVVTGQVIDGEIVKST